jgi:hypothetical protein
MGKSSHNIYTLFFGLICILALSVAWMWSDKKGETIIVTSDNQHSGADNSSGTKTAVLPRYQIMFEYPKTYFISTSTDLNGIHREVLLIDTEENRHLNDPNQPPRDGPTSISLDIYANPKHLSPSDWTKQNATVSNYSIRKGEGTTIPSFIAAHDAFQYVWDGLYTGESNVIVNGDFAYVFSVTYNSPADQIRQDFATILHTVTFAISSAENPSPR